uniref:Uncharacterized protein n=1 Tax=Panagrolaimus sp. JU765 TaxID=591449 RepID=A0AC34RLR4_9BILA
MALLYEQWTKFTVLDPLFGNIMKRALAKNDNLIEIIKKEIEDHKQTVDYNSDPRDFIDAFLIEQKKHSGSDVIDGEWSDVQLVAAVYDLFSAGMHWQK